MISTIILLLLPLAIIVMMLSFFALNSSTKFYNRLIVVTLMSIGLAISFTAFNTLLSQPKPVKFEWVNRNIKKVEIISAVIVNKEAIYAWLRFPGEQKPRYYVFDWDKKRAEQLQKSMSAQRRGKGKRGKILMKNPFLPYDEGLQTNDVIIFSPLRKQLPDKAYEK